MKKLIGMTLTILLGASSMALALTNVTQATSVAEGIVAASAPVNAGKPCDCQTDADGTNRDGTARNGLMEVTENVRKEAEFRALTTAEGAALVPKGTAPATGAE